MELSVQTVVRNNRRLISLTSIISFLIEEKKHTNPLSVQFCAWALSEKDCLEHDLNSEDAFMGLQFLAMYSAILLFATQVKVSISQSPNC